MFYMCCIIILASEVSVSYYKYCTSLNVPNKTSTFNSSKKMLKCFFIKEQVRLKLFKLCFCLIVTLKYEKTSGGNGVYFRGLTCIGGLQIGVKDGGRVIVAGLLSSLSCSILRNARL